MRKASSCALVAFLGYRCRGEGGGLIIRSTRAWLPLPLGHAMKEIEDDWKRTKSMPLTTGCAIKNVTYSNLSYCSASLAPSCAEPLPPSLAPPHGYATTPKQSDVSARLPYRLARGSSQYLSLRRDGILTRSQLMDSILDAVHPQISGPTTVLLPNAYSTFGFRTPSVGAHRIIRVCGW